MDIDLAALRALERERGIALDVLIPAIEQALAARLPAHRRAPTGTRAPSWTARPGTSSSGRVRRTRSLPPRVRSTTRATPPGRAVSSGPSSTTPRPGSAGSRRHGPPGHRPAPARHRGRRDPRRLQGPRGRHRRRHHPAEPRPAARARSTSAPSRASCRSPSRCPARATCTASGCAASSSRSSAACAARRSACRAPTPTWSASSSRSRCPRSPTAASQIAALAREAGHRTKIAVHSTVPGRERQGRLHRPDGRRACAPS